MSSARPPNIKKRSGQNQSQRNMMATSNPTGDEPAYAGSAGNEDEPLLGRVGDVQQREDRHLLHNLYLGTGALAQVGIWVLVGIVWGAVFTHDLIFFSAHPLLNSAGILLLTQGVLILQPTSTQGQKISGTFWHAGMINFGNFALVAGFIIIEINKGDHAWQFESPHAILGLITYIFLLIQWFAGASMFFFPKIYGSVARAKSLYKYHRISGYVMLVLFLATVCAATQTDYNKTTLHIRLWTVIVAAVLLLAGVLSRAKKHKLGL